MEEVGGLVVGILVREKVKGVYVMCEKQHLRRWI